MHTRRLGAVLAGVVALAASAVLTAAAAEDVVAEGAWQKIDYAVSGRWRIAREGSAYVVLLGDDFETKNGPDLHILLSPKPLHELTNANAGDGALVVGLLQTRDTSLVFKKMKGAQSLPIPAGTDLAAYRTIVIHCVEFSHLWAGSAL